MSDKYILRGKQAVLEPDLLAWAAWFETADRAVARTDLPGDVTVCTTFLGLDHGFPPRGRGEPVLYETMVFGGPLDGEQCRYHTWDEAEAGHRAMVARLNAV